MHDQNTNAATPVRFLPIAEVCQIVGLGESTVWERTRAGTFPKPVKLSERTTRWVSTEVDRWVAEVIARRA
ncbi:AlpA family phage regulatory protein [Stenotrophomonas sp. BSUC-16]|uniref:helix-turn-helix transcriptional regulator n=1 Tax=Stenotrophomonas TaxID=40323 RepID=UPI000DA89201|nr:AlpA family phage regulatory protein [Stenotrophomonas maltophilia]MBA0238692.1 AlpA family phage regulatory protein [Stenotrophomonas maltophilia]PZS75056.1 transcriptional regulator [Stenotrophomonas maltophilia]